MPLIPEELVDEVQARADIAEWIGRYVPLKRAGRHFKANCPFHKEKTPSFMVNTDKQIFHCFGCGTGGNIFSFLMQHDRLTFPEAVRQLADHVGVPLPEASASPQRDAREALAPLMEKICGYFERRLADPQAGKAARAYLQQRGVSEATRKLFRLGLAPAGWRGLLTASQTGGVSAQQLEAAGLTVQGRSNAYDRFRNRLIFPITDARGRIVSFGGRSLDGQEPKYLNGPETALYTKGRHLFGLAQAKDAIIEAKTAIVVEGYFDCVVLAETGFRHVVAPLGTALTADQARLLKRYAERVVLAFDADAAGEQATLRGIDLLIEAGLDVRVARLPDGADPDEVARDSAQRFQEIVDCSQSLFDVLVESALKRHPGRSAEQKVQAAQQVLPTIAKVPDAMLRAEYVRLLAERLRLDEQAVVRELAKAQPRGTVPAVPAVTPQAPVVEGCERTLSALLLEEPSRWAQVEGRILAEDVADLTLRRIVSVVAQAQHAARTLTSAQVVSRLSDVGIEATVAVLLDLSESIANKSEALEKAVHRIRYLANKRQVNGKIEKLKSEETSGQDSEAQRSLVVEINSMNNG